MFKKILVPLGDSPHTSTALLNACILAEKLSSEVICLHVVDEEKIQAAFLPGHGLSEVMASTEAPDKSHIIKAVQKELLKEEKTALKYFESARENHLNVKMSWKTSIGSVHTEVIKKEEEFEIDLMVLGKSINDEEEDLGFLGSVFREAVCNSSCPVMICTHTYSLGNNLMVCYDGNEHADKALNAACECAKAFNVPLRVLTTWWNLSTAQDINAKGVKRAEEAGVEVIPIVHSMNTTGAILGEIDHLEIDFLFMGAYSHSRLREILLGSVTDNVISQTGCPVILFR